MPWCDMESTSREPNSLLAAVYGCIDAIADQSDSLVDLQPEEQLKNPVRALLEQVGSVAGLTVETAAEPRASAEIGRPDIAVSSDGLLAGFVELKRPCVGSDPTRFVGANLRQWQRFKELPNLIYTDGIDWRLFREGVLAAHAKLADDPDSVRPNPLDQNAINALEVLIQDFLRWQPIVASSARELARHLAPLSRLLRQEVESVLERRDSSLNRLASEWRELLFPDADDHQFADAYAQTLTYALLLARFEGASSLARGSAMDALDRRHALLAQALNLLESTSVRQELQIPISLLERTITVVDASEFSADVDPWLYFYEHFLESYDPDLRKARGVYFTPVEVVKAQVRFVDELLRERFAKHLSFADPEVTTLDPAAGTGTYPLAVIDAAATAIEKRNGIGAVPSGIQDLASNLHAFEILVGPYSVAHLRVAQKLRDLGAGDALVNIYLNDTLESPTATSEFRASLTHERLAEEHSRARSVKSDTRVFVCLGNPPYDRQTRAIDGSPPKRKGGWVRFGDGGADEKPILEDFIRPVIDSGNGLHLKNVYNDYVYFWRWALWKVFDSTSDPGIVTFITASSYLRGPGFAGMRRKMREVFDELWIIDLQGDSIGARKTENVFAIRPAVAVAIGIREGAPNPGTPATVRFTRLDGSAAEKLEELERSHSLRQLRWDECETEWDAPFFPTVNGAYATWPRVTDVFPWQHSGSQLKRQWPIASDPSVLERRWKTLVSSSRDRRSRLFRETRDRRIDRQYSPLRGTNRRSPSVANSETNDAMPKIERYAYRSFDRQWILADSRVGDFLRPAVWRAHGEKQVYLTSALTDVMGIGPAATATCHVPDIGHFYGRGAKDIIPLWRNSTATKANVNSRLFSLIRKTLGRQVTAEDLFAYAYAILSSPSFVDTFWDQLELPPPRIPITKDPELFQRAADHGCRLLYLHTYARSFAGSSDDGAVPQGNARCTNAVPGHTYPTTHSYDAETGVLHVGEGQFAPVSEAVYGYRVSGFQVVKSWLDMRKPRKKGRITSPLDEIRPERWSFTNELLELLWVLEHTLDLQPEGEALLRQVVESDCFADDELPQPLARERVPPSPDIPPNLTVPASVSIATMSYLLPTLD